MNKRDRILLNLETLRLQIHPGVPVKSEFFWQIIDAIQELLKDSPLPEGSDPWDDPDPQERAAIQEEPPSVYVLLKNPKL